MPTVACREVPERTLLCLKRNIYEEGAWALGKEFVKIFRDRPLPRMQGRIGAAFSIYWGTVSADSDGPIEWCRPIPSEGAAETAANYPELEMRVEPAHREAFVPIEPGVAVADWQAAFQSLEDWREEHGILTKDLTISPEDLGIRITYLASGLPSDAAVPDCDLAVPFA